MSTSIATIKDLREQLATKFQEQKDAAPPSSTTAIKLSKDGFELPNGQELDELEVVVVDYVYVNTLYGKFNDGRFTPDRYVPGQVKPPNCWAINQNYANMEPDPSSKLPVCDFCADCPANEWESAGGGSRGKACKNSIRLAVIPPDAVDKTPVWTLTLAPTSTKDFIKLIQKSKVPVQTLVLHLSMDPKVDYPKVVTKQDRQAPDSIAAILVDKMNACQDILYRGFDFEAA